MIVDTNQIVSIQLRGDRVQLNGRAAKLLEDIWHGRLREEHHCTAPGDLEELKRQRLVFSKPGRWQVPRTSADFARVVRTGINAVQHEELHLTQRGTDVLAQLNKRRRQASGSH